MLSGTVDSLERLFVKEADEIVLSCDFLHYLHRKLVVISSDVSCCEDRCELVLCGSNFVMLCSSKDSELPEFFVQVLHESLYAGLDNAEVMIFHLLALRRKCSEKCSACVNEILSLIVHLLVDEEVFLLRSDCCSDGSNVVLSEDLHDTQSLLVDGFHRTEQRCLLIECFSVVRAESCRNAEDAVLDECEGSRIPCGISSCLECCTDSAGRE